MSFRIDLQDILFTLEEHLKIERLLSFERYKESSMEDFRLLLEEARKFSEEVLAPVNAEGDREGVKLENGAVTVPATHVEAYRQFIEAGWCGMGFAEELGGYPVPRVIGTAISEMFTGANVAFMLYPGLTRGAAELLLHHAGPEMKEKYLPKMVSGERSGTMCLTEAQAGSAVGDLSCTAVKEGDHYLLKGTKIFISSGDHNMTENIIHLVLARIEGDPPGTKGISIFVVPKFLVNKDGSLGQRNDVCCESIEHKMGIKASATCTLTFGDRGKCVGYLIGAQRSGMRIMFHLMNEARLLTGLQGESIAAAAYGEALDYAKERIQGVALRDMKNIDAPRVAIIEHPDVRRMLMNQKALVEGMRALLLRTAYYLDISEISTDDDERQRAQDLVDLLTPICKAFCSDMGFRVTELAVQTFGGYGYCSDYPVEQHLRDCKISSIYEGTNGIQALDLLGRKLGRKNGRLVMTLMEEMDRFMKAEAEHPSFGKELEKFGSMKDRLLSVIMSFGGYQMRGDFEYPALSSVPFLYMFGYTVVGWLLLEQAVEAESRLHALYFSEGAASLDEQKALRQADPKAAHYHNKALTARFFIANIFPQAHALADAIESEDRSPLELSL